MNFIELLSRCWIFNYSMILTLIIICLTVNYLLRSTKFFTILQEKCCVRKSEKVKYNAKADDPKAERIDGNGRCYPNCASDVWLRSCEKEIIEPIKGEVKGHIPPWLNGSLLRNGPGNWKVGDMTFQHLFDCSALLHRFHIRNGTVTYQNRFVQTETLKRNTAAQRIIVTEFGTTSVPDPCHSIFDRISAIFRPDSISDNSMISIYPFGDEYYTFTEAPVIHRINPETLETEARLCISDYVGIVNHTSHPHIMADKSVYNLGMSTTRTGPAYNVVCFPHGNSMFESAYVVGSIPCRWKLNPGYMHTFGVTENFFVIVEQPLSVSVPSYVKSQLTNTNYSACLKWFGDKCNRFHLMDRKTGKVSYTFRSEAFFYLHIVNQYEADDHVVIDICCYKDPEMINCMYLESMVNMQSNPNYASMFRGRPLRFVLPLNCCRNVAEENRREGFSRRQLRRAFSLAGLGSRLQQRKFKRSESQYEDITTADDDDDDTSNPDSLRFDDVTLVNLVSLSETKAEAYQMPDKTILLRPELLCELGCETPRINYENYLGKKYKFFYAISSDVDADNPGTLIKVDVQNKTSKKWCEKNCYPSEPIFVPTPNSPQDEDDGVVLASMVWGGLNDNHVGLLVLCAKTWTEMGRCEFRASGPIPKCLHGWFASEIVNQN